jgi:hypothetical protein
METGWLAFSEISVRIEALEDGTFNLWNLILEWISENYLGQWHISPFLNTVLKKNHLCTRQYHWPNTVVSLVIHYTYLTLTTFRSINRHSDPFKRNCHRGREEGLSQKYFALITEGLHAVLLDPLVTPWCRKPHEAQNISLMSLLRQVKITEMNKSSSGELLVQVGGALYQNLTIRYVTF